MSIPYLIKTNVEEYFILWLQLNFIYLLIHSSFIHSSAICFSSSINYHFLLIKSLICKSWMFRYTCNYISIRKYTYTFIYCFSYSFTTKESRTKLFINWNYKQRQIKLPINPLPSSQNFIGRLSNYIQIKRSAKQGNQQLQTKRHSITWAPSLFFSTI